MLADALDPAMVRTGAQCVGFEQDKEGVTVRFADGSEERGRLLIGADGLQSVIRKQMSGDTPPYAGYTLWMRSPTSTIPSTRAFSAFSSAAAIAASSITLARRGGCTGPAWESAAGRHGRRGHAQSHGLERYRGWEPPFEELIRSTEEAAISRTDVFGGQMMQPWGEGRVTRMGDAVHPMTTNLGQGACMATEDALVLAKCLKEERDEVTALRTYEARRSQRAGAIMKLAKRFNSSAGRERPVACWLRDQAIKYVFKPVLLKQYEAELARVP